MRPLEEELLARLEACRPRSIAFLQGLLRVPSPNPPGDTRAAANFLQRALVASVFRNRLRKKIGLDCDPTVIYALEQAGRYNGRLLLADLRVDSHSCVG